MLASDLYKTDTNYHMLSLSIQKIHFYSNTASLLSTVYARRQNFAKLAQRYTECVNSMLDDTNLWNDLGFSLYAMLSVYYIVIIKKEV